MSAKRYYKYALLSPLIVPFVMLLVEESIRFFTSWETSQLTGLLVMSVLFGGIPYLIFLLGFYRWVRDKNGSRIHTFSYLFPVLYMVIFLFWLVVYIAFVRPERIGNLLTSEYLWDTYYTFGKIAVAIAYSYIVLINIGYWTLRMGNRFSANGNST